MITLNGTAPNATVESNLTFNGSTLNVTGNVVATSFTGSFYTTPSAPTNLVLTQVGGTVTVEFDSASGEVHRYEVWSSVGDTTNYNLIGVINEDNVTATMEVVDDTFNRNATIYYSVYAIRHGKYSTALSGNVTVTGNVADVTGMRVMEALEGYHLEWTLPNDNRLQQVEVNVDSADTLGGLSEGASSTFYTGIAEHTFYEVPEADANKFHQFWIYAITRT